MNPINVTVALSAASATAVTTAQTLVSAGNFTINGVSASGGVATFTTARRVLLTFAANETGHTFTVFGTNRAGNTISESVAGTPAGTVNTYNDFLTVTAATSSAATTGNVSFGTSGVGSSRWVYVSPHMTPFNLSLSAHYATGTGTFEFQYAYDDPAGKPSDFPATRPNVTVYTDAGGAQSGPYDVGYDHPFTCWRITVLSGAGTVSATGNQAGIAGP